MPEQIPEILQKKIADRLGFYEDMGIRMFYRDRGTPLATGTEQQLETARVSIHLNVLPREEVTLAKTVRKPELPKPAPAIAPATPKRSHLLLPVAGGPSLFSATEIPKLNWFLLEKAPARMKMRKDCRSSAAPENC
jgi:hypothetical protein